MENKKKKIIIFSVIGVAIILIIVLSITYAYWRITKEQTEVNVVGSDCFSIEFTGEDDITLNDAYPLDDTKLESFLASATPYHFTITNKCSSLASATINLESLNAGGEKQLADEWIDAILYEDDYHNKLNRYTKLTLNPNNDENKVIEDAIHAYSLKNFTLKANEQRDYYLLLYLDPQTPLSEDTTNASWQGKITLNADYKQNRFANAGTLRKINNQIEYNDIVSYDTSGLWQYRENMWRLYIEPTISEKVAGEGETLYGPFEEGTTDEESLVQSYVICNEADGCTGYLQGNGGIKLNPDSSGVFAGFNVPEIIGMEYLDTSEVTNMSFMFYGDGLKVLDLSHFDTSEATDMSYMFSRNEFFNLDLSHFDTSKVTNMEGMFSGLQTEQLDLSHFDTSKVTNIDIMFEQSVIPTLNLSGLDFSSLDKIEYEDSSDIFSGEITSVNMDNVKLPNEADYFFRGAYFESLSLKNLTFGEAENIFYGLQVENVDLSGANLANKDTIFGMFTGSSILNLKLNNIDFSNLKAFEISPSNYIHNIFCNSRDIENCEEPAHISSIDISNSKLPQIADKFFENIISENNEITINLENVDTSNIKSADELFPNIDTLNIENFVFPKDSSNMFDGNTLSMLNFNNIDTSNVINMNSMFLAMNNVQQLDLQQFNTENVIDMNYMFQNNAVQELTLSSFDTSKVMYMDGMFSEMNNIENLDISTFNTSNVINMDGMFASSSITSITYGSNFIHNVEASTSSMFLGCTANKPNGSVHSSWEGIFD